MMHHFTPALFYAILATSCAALDIRVSSTGGNITSGLQYGIMFEDINHSGDGGIYAELIRNRAFQGFPPVIFPWTPLGNASLSLQNLSIPLSTALPTSLRVSSSTNSTSTVGVENPGFWGIEVKRQKYTGSFWVRGTYEGVFEVALWNSVRNETVGSVKVEGNSSAGEWREHVFEMTPSLEPGNVNNTFRVTWNAAVSRINFMLRKNLFPPTYNDRPNGLRPELMKALKGLNPSFLRFPGGNNLEGEEPPYYLQWNTTVGPLKDRAGYPGTWTYENTNGLGLIEYLQWCDDLDMEPVLAIWAGFYLEGPVVDENALQPYIDEALDELEFLMGDSSTPMGAWRTQLGYPEPWKIKYVEVGNEDNLGGGGASYANYRFPLFKDAIQKKYPDIVVFASAASWQFAETSDAGEDYHQYTRPDYFVGQFGFFDNFTTGFKTMIGEYAAVQPNVPQGGGVNWSDPRWAFPEWIGTVSEAVFLIGAERNADKIFGAAYAPTLQNLNSYQWSPDLISYTADTNQTVLSTSYHQLALFSAHRISVLPISSPTFGPAYYVAGHSNATNSYILKIAVYNATTPLNVSVVFDGVREGATGKLTVLSAPAATSYNSVGSNVVVENVTAVTVGASGAVEFELPDLSVSVLEIMA